MSSMNFGNNDQWHLYQKQIQESQDHAEENQRKEDPLHEMRKQEPSYVFSTALISVMRDSINEKWNDLFKRIDTSMLNLATQKAFSDLKALLQELEERDVSMELTFLLNLSRVWNNVDHAVKGIQEHPSAANLAIRGYLFQLYDEIASCRKGQEYPLIHYLKEHAGTSWVPFPFMHILRTLHEEYHAGHPNSDLKRWLHMIDAILERAGTLEDRAEFDMP